MLIPNKLIQKITIILWQCLKQKDGSTGLLINYVIPSMGQLYSTMHGAIAQIMFSKLHHILESPNFSVL